MNYKRIDAKPDRDNSRYIQLRNTKTGAYTDIKDVKKIMGIPFRLHDKSFIIFSDGNDDCYLPISNDKVKLPDAKELPWLYSDSIGMGMATRFDYYWNMNKKWVRRLIKVLFFVLLCIVCYISLCCLNMSQIN